MDVSKEYCSPDSYETPKPKPREYPTMENAMRKEIRLKKLKKEKRRLVISGPSGQVGRRREISREEGTQQQPGGTSRPAYIWAGCLICLEGDRHTSSLEVSAGSVEQQRCEQSPGRRVRPVGLTAGSLCSRCCQIQIVTAQGR